MVRTTVAGVPRKSLIILGIFTILILGLRLFLAFSSPYFTYDAYNTLIDVERISESGAPLFYDDLFAGGRVQVFAPVFPYVLAFFNLFLDSDLVGKVIPNLFAVSLIFILYFLGKTIIKHDGLSLILGIVSGFLPLFFVKTLHTVSVFTFFLPLFFLLIYAFLNLDKKYATTLYVVLLFVLGFTHPTSLLLLPVFVFYAVLLVLDSLHVSKAEIELMLFSVFALIWMHLLVYKKALLQHGVSVIWQNTPTSLLATYFSSLDLLSVVYAVGFIPLLFGLYAIYHHFFEVKNKSIVFLTCVALSFLLMLWLKLMPLTDGLMFVSVVFLILMMVTFKHIFIYFQQTKKPFVFHFILVLVIIAFIFTSLIPFLNMATASNLEMPTTYEVGGLLWLNEHSPEDAVILAPYQEGGLIKYYANRGVVLDDRFLLVEDAEDRFRDVNKLFVTRFETDAVQVFNNYNARYLYFSHFAQVQFGIEEPYFIGPCLRTVYSLGVTIYKNDCTTVNEDQKSVEGSRVIDLLNPGDENES